MKPNKISGMAIAAGVAGLGTLISLPATEEQMAQQAARSIFYAEKISDRFFFHAHETNKNAYTLIQEEHHAVPTGDIMTAGLTMRPPVSDIPEAKL